MHFYLETNHLILREFRTTDAEALFEMDADPRVHRYLGNQPMRNVEQAKQVIAAVQEQYQRNKIGRWMAIEKFSGNIIGWVGLKLNESPKNNHTFFYDVGYRLHPNFWGKGYATESTMAALQYGFEIMELETIVGTCHEENLASRRVLEKCGLRFVENFLYDDSLPCIWLEIKRMDWLGQFLHQ